ncbi:MAG: helix-turn-helix transcriptional regulator [Planctomycetaceae bacterium]|jgi:transcriptional regulator with XRE-family HTH domain|nr:helix-turn-helix transcriptional regulator [Planctomycetaceae bacterium]
MPALESTNLRRLLAQHGLTIAEVARRADVDRRTVLAMLNDSGKPHPKTIYRLAEALGVSVDEFYVEPSQLLYRQFDQETNPLVAEVVETHSGLFDGWTAADFDELHSRFGSGGALTHDGVVATAEEMNLHRSLHDKLAVLLESSHKDLTRKMIELLYDQATATGQGLSVLKITPGEED